MYKGLARLVGMDIVGKAQTLDEQMDVLEENWEQVRLLLHPLQVHRQHRRRRQLRREGEADRRTRRRRCRGSRPSSPTVLIVTGDHSTPSFLKSHSWHPVPTLLVSDCCRSDGLHRVRRTEPRAGGLGQFEAKYLMLLALVERRPDGQVRR